MFMFNSLQIFNSMVCYLDLLFLYGEFPLYTICTFNHMVVFVYSFGQLIQLVFHKSSSLFLLPVIVQQADYKCYSQNFSKFILCNLFPCHFRFQVIKHFIRLVFSIFRELFSFFYCIILIFRDFNDIINSYRERRLLK